MPDEPNLSLWLDKSTAAKALGVSERTLERMVQAGKGPECRQRPRPGVKPEPVYNPQDVETLTAAQRSMIVHPDSALVPEIGAALVDAGHAARELMRADSFVRSVEPVLARIAASLQPHAAPAAPKLWMTLQEASTYSGLSKAFLRRLIAVGAVSYLRDRAIKIPKSDLDNLDIGDILSQSVEKDGARHDPRCS